MHSSLSRCALLLFSLLWASTAAAQLDGPLVSLPDTRLDLSMLVEAAPPTAGTPPPPSAPDAATLAQPARVRCGDLLQLSGVTSLGVALLRGEVRDGAPALTVAPTTATDPSTWWLVRGSSAQQSSSATHLGCAPGAPLALGDVVQLENALTGKRLGDGASVDLRWGSGTTAPLAVGAQVAPALDAAPTRTLAARWAGSPAALTVSFLTGVPQAWSVAARKPSVLRESAEAVRCGATLRLRHVVTGVALHSHALNGWWWGGSGQQQVTGFAGRDDNDLFVVQGRHGGGCAPGAPLRQGDVVRLTHRLTGRNLHSHAGFVSPGTWHQEVTAFGAGGVGDANDDWRVVVPGEGERAAWLQDTGVRLVHVNTGATLRSDAAPFAIFGPWVPGPSQQEISASAAVDGASLWTVETHTAQGDDQGGARRALVIAHRQFGSVADGEAGMQLRALTELGYVVEYANLRHAILGAALRWAATARAGQRRYVYVGAHGGGGLRLAQVLHPETLAGTREEQLGRHAWTTSEERGAGATLQAQLLAPLAGMAQAGVSLAVFDGSCEGGNTVLALEGVGACALSTTSFEGPGLTSEPAVNAVMGGFSALATGTGPQAGRGAGALQRSVLQHTYGRVQQRLWRTGCGATQAQMTARTGLMRLNVLGTWRLGGPEKGVVRAEQREGTGALPAPAVVQAAMDATWTDYELGRADTLAAIGALQAELASPATALARWTYAARGPGLWRELLPDGVTLEAVQAAPAADRVALSGLGVDPTPWVLDRVRLDADLAALVAQVRALQADREFAWRGLRAALTAPQDPRATLPTAMRDALWASLAPRRALVVEPNAPQDLLVDLDRMWARLDGYRNYDVLWHAAHLRWVEAAQDSLLRRVKTMLALREDAACAEQAARRPCDDFTW